MLNGSAESEARRFCDYYDSNGWMVGKNKMKNWRSAVSGWVSRNGSSKKDKSTPDFSVLNDKDFWRLYEVARVDWGCPSMNGIHLGGRPEYESELRKNWHRVKKWNRGVFADA